MWKAWVCSHNLGAWQEWMRRKKLSLPGGFCLVNVLVLLLFSQLMTALFFHAFAKSWQVVRNFSVKEDFGHKLPDDRNTFELMSPALLKNMLEAVRKAGGVPGKPISWQERLAWTRRHPCRSRTDMLLLYSEKHASNVSSSKLESLLGEYANLHRTCTKQAGDLTSLYKSKNSSLPCKFLVVEFGSYGVGNRLLWLASSFAYALVTQRVILIDTQSTIDELICEPFMGSSWKLPVDFPYSSSSRWTGPNDFFSKLDDLEKMWNPNAILGYSSQYNGRQKTDKSSSFASSHRDFRERDTQVKQIKFEGKAPRRIQKVEKRSRKRAGKLSIKDSVDEIVGHEGRGMLQKDNDEDRPIFHSLQVNDGWNPNARFFCDHEQSKFLANVTWLNLNSGCLYFLPDLYAIPSFESALEELFPDRNPLTHILRHVMLPVDPLWAKVKRIHKTHFSGADRVIGMQVRYRDGVFMYQTLNSLVNKRITSCCIDRGFLPAVDTPSASPSPRLQKQAVVIFIASLHEGLQHHLVKLYSESPNFNSSVKIVQLSSIGFQLYDLEGDHQALQEILALSLSDEILTSPISTYGYVAQAYGGLTPWLINFEKSSEENCYRGQNSDACYQLGIDKFTCRYDSKLDGAAMLDVLGYLKPCQDYSGLQLVPRFQVPLNNSSRD